MFGAPTTVALTERSSDWFDRFGRPYGPQYALVLFFPLNGMPTTVQGTEWPSHGEIDIIEGVNLMPNNEYSLHANPGFAVPGNSSQTGKFLTTDCSQGNGCAINETAPNSFGEGFAQNGGGVWAAQFDTSGILWVQSGVFCVAAKDSRSCLFCPKTGWSQHLVLERKPFKDLRRPSRDLISIHILARQHSRINLEFNIDIRLVHIRVGHPLSGIHTVLHLRYRGYIWGSTACN